MTFFKICIFQDLHFSRFAFFKTCIFQDLHFFKICIFQDLHFSRFAFFQDLHFSRFAFFKICIFQDSHFSRFAFFTICIFHDCFFSRFAFFKIGCQCSNRVKKIQNQKINLSPIARATKSSPFAGLSCLLYIHYSVVLYIIFLYAFYRFCNL